MSIIKVIPFIFTAFVLHTSVTVIGQSQIDDAEKNKIIFKGNHIGFNISWLAATKANIERTTGNYPMSSSAVPGAKLGCLYHINFNTAYSLNVGAEAAVTGTNFILSIHKNDFTPQLKQDYSFTGRQTSSGNLVLSMPVTAEKRFWYKQKNFFSAELGASINYSTGADADIKGVIVEDVDNNVFQAAEIYVNANNDLKPWLSYLLTVAHSWRLRNNNYIQLGIQSNLSFTKYVNGDYSIYVPGRLTSGRYTSSGSYGALFFSYILTNGNYRLRKQYEHISIAWL